MSTEGTTRDLGRPQQSLDPHRSAEPWARNPIEYRPLDIEFTDGELEKGFRTYFHHQLSAIDFSWSFITAIMSVAYVRQLKELDPSARPPLLADLLGSLAFSAAICCGCALAPARYVAVRTPVLVAFRLWHQAALLRALPELTPPDAAMGSIHAVPPHTPWGLALRLFGHCTFAAAASNGYQLLALPQALSAVLNVLHHLRKGLYTCGLPAEAGGEAGVARLYAGVAGRLGGAFSGALLPLTLAPAVGPAGAPAAWQAQCSALYLWAVGTFGCLAPLAVALAVEERYRWGYLRERGVKALAPRAAARVAHGAAGVGLGAAALWAALGAAQPWAGGGGVA